MTRAELIKKYELKEKDISQIENSGVSWESLAEQIEIFENGLPYVNIVRPCTIRDGINEIDDLPRGS